MMFRSFDDLIGVDLVRFEAFSQYLCGVPEHKFIEWSWRGKVPPIFRIGHGPAYWDREAIQRWIADQYLMNRAKMKAKAARKAKAEAKTNAEAAATLAKDAA